MSCYSKEKMDRNDQNNLCKSHSVRSDRELYRICPSKLSKRELEDLYFSLLENNIELKRTINGQQDKIRGLSTKVQRMNATQKNLQNKEVKDCCIGTKAIINEQKESITELKRANQRMADRIQMLNMRLCSAKQFFKKPAQPSTSRCLRCAANGGTCTPKKHNCLDKANEPAVLKVSTSTQVDERSITMKAAQTETSEDDIKEPSGQTCDENKCRSLMEELKLKIVHLQDELFTVHEEYASRITRLEGEVCDVRRENTRVTAQRKASEHELHNLLQRNTEILATCRNTHSRCAELAAQLSIERRKVAELETQLKASNMSDKVNKTIEDHLTTRNDTNGLSTNVPLEEPGDFVPKCSCPRAHKDKAAAKNAKCIECGCPPYAGDSEDSDKVSSTKSNSLRGKLLTVKGSRSNKPSKARTPTMSERRNSGIQEGKFTSCECPPLQNGEPGIFFAENAKIVTCGCPPPRESSTPTKEKKGVDCGCPAWNDVDMLLTKHHQDERSGCEKCCHKVQESSRSSTTQTGTLPAQTVEVPQSPTVQHEDPKLAKASDDSGYTDSNKSQDTDDLMLNKMNKELIDRILQLQRQVDALKITGAAELPTPRRSKVTEFTETPTNSLADSATIQEDYNSMKPERNESTMTTVNRIGTAKPLLSISRENSKSSMALSPEGTVSVIDEQRRSEDFRVRTMKDSQGVIHMPDEQFQSDLIIVSPTIDQPHKRYSSEAYQASEPEKYQEPSATTQKEMIHPAKAETDDNRKLSVIAESEPSKLELEREAPNDVKCCSDDIQQPYRSELNDAPKAMEPEAPNGAQCCNDDIQQPYRAELNNAKAMEPEASNGAICCNDDIQQPYRAELNEARKSMEPETTLPKSALVHKSPPYQHHQEPDETLPVIESVPSNPELGFAIPRLESKQKRESMSDTKRLNETRSPSNDIEMLPGKLKLPMTDALVANQGPADKTRDPSSPIREECEHCPACSFNKQCAQQSRRNTIDNIANKSIVAKMLASKDDRHNSLQIPGPIPAEPNNKKRSVFRHFSLEKKKDKNGKQKKESLTREDISDQQKILTEETSHATADGPINLPDVPLIHKSSEQLEGQPDDYYSRRRDSLSTSRKRLSRIRSSIIKTDSKPTQVPDSGQNVSINNYLPQTDRMSKAMSPPYNREVATEMERKSDEAQTTEQNQQDQGNQVPNDVVGGGVRRDVSVYRRGSGTLCFRTLRATARPMCSCAPPHCSRTRYNQGSNAGHESKEVQVPPPPMQHERTSTASEHDTYTVDKQSRATSPDSTEFEITYLSDLPLEKEKASPMKTRPFSPGEDKTTTTYTDSSCSPDTNYTLSEGEMPICSNSKRKYSHDRDGRNGRQMNGTMAEPAEKPCEKIESALQAVTDEIARCNTLLKAHRPTPASQSRRESESVHSQTSEVDPSRPIALRRGVATSSIGDVYVPKCLFTLHIGTVVLSDEAVLNSRDKTLVLTWKFYDQNIAMTRMRAGRVVLFDFSTEYDIKITDDFLHYMKHEEMPIVICELDKEDQPFASCALPLRDALLHTNRRADMSLALVAGPQMLQARAAEGAAADALDARDEMGVIDLWCMLRADAKMLSGINLAIAQPSVPEPESKAYHVRNSRVMPQILDDDHNDLDLNLVKSTPATTLEPTVKNYGSSIVEYARSSSLWSNRAKPAPAPAPAYAPAPAPAPAPAYTSSPAPNYASSPAPNYASSPAPNYASSHTPNYVPSPAPNYAPTPAPARAPAPAPAAPVPVDAQTQTPSAPQTANKAEMMYDPSNYPPVRSRRLSCVSTVTAGGQPVPFSPPAQPVFDKDDPEHDSGIIINEVQANIKSPGDMRHALEQRSGQALNEMGRGIRKSEEDLTSQAQSSLGSLRSVLARLQRRGSRITSRSDNPQRAAIQNIQRNSKNSTDTPTKEQGSSMEIYKKYENISKLIGSNKDQSKKSVKIVPKYMETDNEVPQRDVEEGWAVGAEDDQERTGQNLDITVLWLALNEECEAMIDPHVQRVYVAYTFLGRTGAELETPISLPKPKHYVDKCYFNFRKTFELEDTDLLKLSHMARCRAASKMSENERDCIVFSVVSEPPEDPLGLESCEDIGYAYLYLGDLLAYSAGSPGYTEVIPVRAAGGAAVCGVLAVRLDGLDVVRRCLLLPSSERDADWET